MLRFLNPELNLAPDNETARLHEIESIVLRFRVLIACVISGLTIANVGFTASPQWIAVIYMFFSCALTWFALRTDLGLVGMRVLGAYVLASDVLIVLGGMVTGDVGVQERGIYIAGFIIVLEAAVRWLVVGGIIGGVAMGIDTWVWMAYRYETEGISYRVDTVIFRAFMFIVVGLTMGVLMRALERARDEVGRRLEESRAVQKLAFEAPRTDEREAAAMVASVVHTDLEYDRVLVLLHDSSDALLVPVAHAGYDTDRALAGLTRCIAVDDPDDFAAIAYREHSARISAGVPAAADGIDPDTRAAIALPLRAGGRTLGVLVVGSRAPQAFREEHEQLLSVVAGELAQVLENARLGEVQRRTIDELQQVATMKDDFIAVASHELRTPLTALRGWVRPLDDDRLSPEQRARAVEKISRGVDRLAALVEDLLAVSLIDGGRSNPAAESIDLRALLDDVVAEVDPHDGLHRIVVSVPPDLGPVAADRSFLRRVLVNLIGNGVKYSPGGGVVSIVASSVAGDVPMAQVSVSDEGMGVPEGELDRLFAKFERCSNTRGTSGTGLGLYVVRGLVEAMGGGVSVTSVEGEGTRFSFTLPLMWRAERRENPPSEASTGHLETSGEIRQTS